MVTKYNYLQAFMIVSVAKFMSLLVDAMLTEKVICDIHVHFCSRHSGVHSQSKSKYRSQSLLRTVIN